MAFNPKQFKVKKKRAVDPNAPPRPNLMSHDKVIRETKDIIASLQMQVRDLNSELSTMKSKYADMQQSISQILNHLRKGR